MDMGKPVQIAELAKSLIYLHGRTLKDENNPKGEIEIKYTGLRAGEKLYEELLIDETAESTTHEKICRAREHFIAWPELEAHLAQFEAALETDPNNNMVSLLKQVVPGYKPDQRFAQTSPTETTPPLAPTL